MIRAIANKRIDLTDDEFEYFNTLKEAFGEDTLLDLFKTNKHGEVTAVTPNVSSPTNITLIFFFLNVTMNQRLRKVESTLNKIAKIEERLSKLEGSSDGKV